MHFVSNLKSIALKDIQDTIPYNNTCTRMGFLHTLKMQYQFIKFHTYKIIDLCPENVIVKPLFNMA